MQKLCVGRVLVVLLLVTVAAGLVGCGGDDEYGGEEASLSDQGAVDRDNVVTPNSIQPAYPATAKLTVDDFLYQLQELDLAAAAASGYDLIIMDYSATGEEAEAYNAAQLAALKNGSGGDKTPGTKMKMGDRMRPRPGGWI
jgi:hypothetical protein